jgi:3-oxoadipate enol-lactonase
MAGMPDSGTETRFVSTPSAKLHVRIDGREGAPWLTCLHSLATNLHLWDAESERLAAYFRVLRLDFRGHGQSSSATDDFTLEDLREDVLTVWDELGVSRSALLGLSIGGMIALELALDAPARVSCLVAADCRADAPGPFRAMWDERRQLLRDRGMEAIVAATLPSWFTPRTLAQRPPCVAEVERMISATSFNGYFGATRALQRLDIKLRLPAMDRPTLYLVGEEDGIHPQAMAEMQELTPGASLTTLPGAAHLSNLEQPEGFYAAVEPFLISKARGENP